MRVLILGAAGQVGAELEDALAGHEVSAPAHADVDVRDAGTVDVAVRSFHPDWVVNCAAFHDVDRCEIETDLAFAVNEAGAATVAGAAARAGARTLYLSTDYVFSGSRGSFNREDDPPDPVNVYGHSKRRGEEATLASDPRGLVARTSAVFGLHPCRGKQGAANFVELMLRLARERGRLRVVDDEIVSPTYSGHLASALVEAMGSGRSGIVHVAGEGGATWLDFARAIVTAASIDATVEPAAAGEFAKKAPRPGCSALVATRAPALPPWQRGLADYLRARKGA